MKTGKSFLVLLIVAVGVASSAGFFVLPQIVSSPQPLVTVYNEYNGTYFPYQVMVVYYPGNATSDPMGFPGNWTVSNYQQDHEAVVPTQSQYLLQGVSWQDPVNELGGGVAIPLSTPPTQLPAANVKGPKSALVLLTQFVGEPLGVTLAGNLLYVEMDSGPGMVAAINPVTGNLVWYATGLASMAMNNPVVWNGIVYVTVGDVGFNFANFVHYEKGQYDQITRGMAYGAVYAFNASNGRLLWMRFTNGEAMAAPAVYRGILTYATGGGCFVGVNATTGVPIWITKLPGHFDSMSSVNYYVMKNGTALFIAGFTLLSSPYGQLVAVNAMNGKVAWEASLPSGYTPFNTGMGDVPPAVDQNSGIVVQSTVANAENGTVDTVLFAVNATNGQPVWVANLGRGATPPAFKGAIPLIYNGTVYAGVPSLGKVFAVKLSTGQILWNTSLPGLGIPPTNPGGPRGAPVMYHGMIYVSAGSSVYVINPHNGKIVSQYVVGGRFGIVNPVIAGSTMFLTNSYGWVIAIPVTQVYPGA